LNHAENSANFASQPAVKTADWYTKQAESLLPDIPQCALAYFLYQPGNLFPGVLAIKAN
jgi:hypothetical protein